MSNQITDEPTLNVAERHVDVMDMDNGIYCLVIGKVVLDGLDFWVMDRLVRRINDFYLDDDEPTNAVQVSSIHHDDGQIRGFRLELPAGNGLNVSVDVSKSEAHQILVDWSGILWNADVDHGVDEWSSLEDDSEPVDWMTDGF